MTDSRTPTEPNVYSLTPLTRRAAATRQVVISGFDLPRRRVLIALAAFLVAVPFMLATWALLGQWALLWIVLSEAAVFVLLESRTRSGLHLRRYRALADRRRATSDVFHCCGSPVDPDPDSIITLTRSTVPVIPTATGTPLTPSEDLLAAFATGITTARSPAAKEHH